MSEVIIGIDLGTTNSEVAVVQDGKIIVIEDNHQKILPSFVGMSDSGEILVGEAAKNQYTLYPEHTIKSIKRQMGQDIKVSMGDKEYSPQEISAIILKRLKSIAENYLGHAVQKAVITVPAYFSDAQRQATREAGEIAGLEVVRMINEPTAAALSYEAQQQAHKKVLVYDLGGGTFDVSVVSIEDDVVEVLASHGNNQLGGDDFDNKIVEYIVEHLEDKHDLDISESPKVMARIARAAEKAKRALSDDPFIKLEEEYLCEKEGTPIHLSLELSRIDYESLIEDYIDETLEAVHIALKGAELTVSNIDEVLLVGGSTRTPMINDRLYQEFGVEPHKEINPDLCVATGAAIQAAMIAGQSIGSVLVDITPYTFGTSVVGELNGEYCHDRFAPIIHKNSSLPISKTEAFCTMFDGQKEVEVIIFQGEDPDALNNIKIDEFIVEGLSDAPAGNVITIQLTLDLNGILQVSAQEKATGLEKSITINNALSDYEETDLEQAKQRINALFNDDEKEVFDAEDEEHHEIIKATALLEKAKRQMEEASDEDKEDMVDLIEQINDAIKAEDFETLSTTTEELADILYYLDE
ncbi:MAG: Hsp70 family protein [Methylococcaceae bacterium]|nr:Hsp70 family protein [Methylococcaceae bacterium]